MVTKALEELCQMERIKKLKTLPDNISPKEKWFYIVTDDGDGFKARFSGKKVKKLSTFADKEIIGRWVKGRLADLDFISGFEYVYQDK